MQFIYYGDTLKHHGVLGQKWGVRRYQPYPKGNKKGNKKGKFIGIGEKNTPKKQSRISKVRSMSDADLVKAVNRLKTEKQYLELSGNSVEQGKSFAQSLLIGVGTTAITTFATTMAIKGGQAAVAAILKKITPSSVFNTIYKKK